MNSLIAIVGPTGTGKSRLALHLASKFQGEIVNADSRLVYRYMDIGTAKPTPQELAAVPHHLIDIVNPDEDFSLAQYQRLAYRAIDNIRKRNRLPFLVGGSGLYVRTVLEGWQVPEVPPDLALRHNLEQMAAEGGVEALYQELLKTDPAAARKIDYRNIRRVIRALEVGAKTNQPFSRFQKKQAPPYHSFVIGLTLERKALYQRIDRRVDAMMEKGFEAEVEKLSQMGYDFTLPAMSSIGYRQIGLYLKGELTLSEAVAQIKTGTHRLVRQQYTWFRCDDVRIHWFDMEKQTDADIEGAASEFLRKEHLEQE